MAIAIFYLIILSVITALVFAYDKMCAKKGLWRVPESVLLFLSALGGAMGGILAMCICRHKTQKQAFINGLPIFIILQAVIMIVAANIFLY